MEEFISPDLFLNVAELAIPKEIQSLAQLWDHMLPKHAALWTEHRHCDSIVEMHKQLIDALDIEDVQLDQLLGEANNTTLYGVIRILQLKQHLEEIDQSINQAEKPRPQIANQEKDILGSKLVLQSFLDYLRDHTIEEFEYFLNNTLVRLVSTVHPNETERNTNLLHYSAIADKFNEWKKDFASLQQLSTFAPEYRIRRESLNQTRRELKAEIEGVYFADQMRSKPIPVHNEAQRLLQRYKTIFASFPTFLKFVKYLARSAYWYFFAGKYANNQEWRVAFKKGMSRDEKLKIIKQTFRALNIQLPPAPRITAPIVTFGTWKGGDRDGNPFVVASFTNHTFLEHKEFVLSQYIESGKILLDKITTSTVHSQCTEELKASIQADAKAFPYIRNIKPHEPYRAKIRFILERLEHTLLRVKELKKSGGETTKPLLGQSLPGVSGYDTEEKLQEDVDLIYNSLLKTELKAQARSLVQDWKLQVDTFGLFLASLDFRQTSSKNEAALKEYLVAIGRKDVDTLFAADESQRRKMLVSLLESKDDENILFDPWSIHSLTQISRDTFESLIIYADAARTCKRAVGKFIISMCQSASDILVMMLLLRITGLMEVTNVAVTYCTVDVTGLFETIEDLKAAPQIIRNLLDIDLIRNYIMNFRNGLVTVMMGYSDSVRDGSALASDSQVAETTLLFAKLEKELNAKYSFENKKKITFSFYRGRGDTIPRGFSGSITRAITAQTVTSAVEDHTEQNRYLRRYMNESSTIDHLHSVYAAHIANQTALKKLPAETPMYQRYFQFFGNISDWKWKKLTRGPDGKPGNCLYFQILNKYSILPHLGRAHFASRPVARDGVTYNIDLIRAIPFVMTLAQMREFTVAYYGTGTAFEEGSAILENGMNTALTLLNYKLERLGDKARAWEENTLQQLSNLVEGHEEPLLQLLRVRHHMEQMGSSTTLQSLFERARNIDRKSNHALLLKDLLKMYDTPEEAISEISLLLLDLQAKARKPLAVLQELYKMYPPFRYSMECKETALLIRNKRIVDDYTRDANEEERAVLDETEREAQLTKKWVLAIIEQQQLQSKILTRNFQSPELFLLHKIQSKFLNKWRKEGGNQALSAYIQSSILAISEGLGFGG